LLRRETVLERDGLAGLTLRRWRASRRVACRADASFWRSHGLVSELARSGSQLMPRWWLPVLGRPVAHGKGDGARQSYVAYAQAHPGMYG